MALEVDRLTPAEIRALDAARQIGILDELFGEMKKLAELKVEAIDLHAKRRIDAVREGRKPQSCPMVIAAKSSLDQVTTWISARRQQTMILQTLLRAVPA